MIHTATIVLSSYSNLRIRETNGRTKYGIKPSMKSVREAFRNGADFLAHNINGVPCETYCSLKNFAPNARVEIREGADCIFYGDISEV